MEQCKVGLALLGATLVLVLVWTPVRIAYGADSFGPTLNLGTGTSVDGQKLAASGSDYVYVVWRNTGNQEIYFKRSTDGGSSFGSTAINLSGTTGASLNPDIVASGSNVYVVYQDNTAGQHDIFLKKSTDYGATFSSTAVRVANTAAASLTPAIAVSGSNVYVVWSENPSGSSYPDVYIAKSTDGGSTFTAPVNLSNTPGSSGHSIGEPQVIAQGSNVYVMWVDTSTVGGYGEIYFRKSTDSGLTFASTVNLSNNAGVSQYPHMAASGSNVYVAWMDNTEYLGSMGLGNSEIYFRKSTDGGKTFSSTIDLANTASDSKKPYVAASSTGTSVSVAWLDIGAGNTDDVWYATSDNSGSTFSNKVNLSNTGVGSSEPNVGFTSAGTAYILWSDYPSTTYKEIMKSTRSSGGTQSSATNLSNTYGSSYNLALATSGNKVYVIWYDTTSGNNGLLFKSI